MSRADMIICLLTHCIGSSATFITGTQTNKQKQLVLTFGLFIEIVMLLDHAFNMQFMTHFAHCQWEACFKNAHFQNGTPRQYETFQDGTHFSICIEVPELQCGIQFFAGVKMGVRGRLSGKLC